MSKYAGTGTQTRTCIPTYAHIHIHTQVISMMLLLAYFFKQMGGARTHKTLDPKFMV